MTLVCEFCGLPTPDPWWGKKSRTGPAYCCFGCRFAHSISREQGDAGERTIALARLGLAIFFAMNVMAFTMALWADDFYGPDIASPGLRDVFHGLFRYLCMIFALPVLWLLGGPLAANAWTAMRRGAPNTDLLLLTGVVASFAYSTVSVFRDSGKIYFEVGVVILVLVTLGRWLEATSKLKASEALDELQNLLPESARVVCGGDEQSIKLSEVNVGDRLRVLPGERIPCDARVLNGTAAVDEQAITGESTPPEKCLGDLVRGGSLAIDGELLIEATARPEGGALARIVEAVRAAGLEQGRYQRLADRAATMLLPIVAGIAIVTATYHGALHGAEQGIMMGLAVLVIACPCALGVATPLAGWVTIGQLAQGGVLVRSGDAIERLASLRAVVFDKTGTLTLERPTISSFAALRNWETTLRNAADLASTSTHPHAMAISAFARHHGILTDANCTRSIRTLPGRGVTAGHGPTRLLLGSPRLLDEHKCLWDDQMVSALNQAQAAGRPVVAFAEGDIVTGVFALREEIRPGSKSALDKLLVNGLRVKVLTGDLMAKANELGRELGVEVVAGLLPEEKLAELRQLQSQFGSVGMVGDGINDAPALAAADVGLALGCGTDLARETAAVCLLGNDLERIPQTIELARRAVRVMRQNLFWAFVYNIVGIGFACTGRLNPVLAALAMLVSSVFVISNSMRLSSMRGTAVSKRSHQNPVEVAA